MASQNDLLVSISNAQLHKVENGVQVQIAQGTFEVYLFSGTAEPRIEALVGDVTWALGKHLPALKAATTIYSFGLEHTQAVYYCLVLPSDTPYPVLESVTDVLENSCALSTVKQVDAAYEEADKLNGGKEAQHLATHAPEPIKPSPAVRVPAAAAGQGPYPYDLIAGPGKQSPAAAAAAAAGAQGPSSSPAAAAGAAAPPGASGSYPYDLLAGPGGKGVGPGAPAAAAAGAAPGAGSAPRPGYHIPPSGNATADKLAAGLAWGGEMIAVGVGKAATAATGMVQGYVDKQVKEGPQPSGKPAKVSPTLKASLKVLATVASTAAYVTGKLAALVGHASYATALAIARSLPGHGARKAAGAAPGEVSEEERSALKTVGAAGLVAYVQVYDALEQATKQVVSSSMESTHQYIAYKYGDEAGQVAKENMPVAQDMLQTTLNFTRLGARAMISKTAKKTASMYLKSTVAGVHIDDQVAGRRVPAGYAAAAAGAPAKQ